ncbi:MAG: competence protein ComEA-like protein with helix-hairpin-helix repeat region [Eubacterium sp.]|jgi:competence protein ComEA|nr:competence protein ComEA-like protein with helix-hairpin-helix repeat region [Eubacterium sp.]
MEISIFGKQYFINKVLLLAVIIVLVLGSGFLGYFLKQVYEPLKEPVVEKSDIVPNKKENDITAEELSEPAKVLEQIKVYIVGCVNKPGVVTLNKGDVIDDALKMAGGASKEADLENINLAYQLNENTMLRIKSKTAGQLKTASEAGATQNSSAGTKGKAPEAPKQTSVSLKQAGNSSASAADKSSAEGTLNRGVDIINDSLGAVVADEQDKAGGESKSNLVNINKATQTELENLPNVGPATAKAIIDYREKNGGFKKITDLMKITGIKQKTFDKIKDNICV